MKAAIILAGLEAVREEDPIAWDSALIWKSLLEDYLVPSLMKAIAEPDQLWPRIEAQIIRETVLAYEGVWLWK